MIDNMIFAFLLTLFAGLATAIGGFISLFVKNKNTTFLSVALGFSAGVMLYVSFVEIFVKANDSLTVVVGESLAPWLTVGGFFLGMFVIGIIDKILSKNKLITVTSVEDDKKKLFKLGIFTAVAISIHNFP
ncbi:MAG: zinc transporter ZupT, partial [bacterium]